MIHEEKVVNIIIESTPHAWPKEKITYTEVVTLEVPDYAQHPAITYSVSFEKGHSGKTKGILVFGASVEVKEGMIFHVSKTGQS